MKDMGKMASGGLVESVASSTGVSSDEVARVLGEIGLDGDRLNTIKSLAGDTGNSFEIEDVRVSVRIGGMIVAV